MTIYDIDNSNRSLTVDRDEAYWRESITWFGPHHKYSFKVAKRNADNVAYMRTRPDGVYLDVIELGMLPDFPEALLYLLLLHTLVVHSSHNIQLYQSPYNPETYESKYYAYETPDHLRSQCSCS